MKLIVFGATGGTGRQVVIQALEAGHEVTVVVRQPAAFDIHHERMEVVQGDVLNFSSIEKPMSGKDVVVSALGVSHRNPTTVYSAGTSNIMKAMRSFGIRRLICLSSGGLDIPADTPFMQRIVIKFIVQRMFKEAYEDMARMEDKVRLSDLDWTVIRPPRLTNGLRTGKYRIASNQHLQRAEGIARADLADYIVGHLDDYESFQSRVEISY
jgi:putative NADH-flavin reductase